MGQGTLLLLHTSRLRLWLPNPRDDADEMLRFYEDNREHLAPWSPPAPPDFYSVNYWIARLGRNCNEYMHGASARLAIAWRDQPQRVIGVCNLTDVIRGGFEACLLGYALARREQGKGVMTEALREAVRYAFEGLYLHRVMANYMPANERSAAVLKSLGFVIEGYARDYLYINGAWRDHVLTALTNPSPRPPQVLAT